MALLLRGLKSGELVVELPDGAEHVFRGAAPGVHARIRVMDPGFARRLIAGGHLALGEGYIDGAWDTPDLDAVLDLGLENISQGWGATRVPALRRPIERLRHTLRDNDPDGGSKRNIAAHYDLGNDFYRLWLDDTMTYSSACLTPDERSARDAIELERAQRRKWDRMLELVQPAPGDHLLEIGCGWGGFALHAAREAGCRVTGLTLSEEQAALAREHVAEEGLEGLVDIRLQDYRRVEGTFDGIVSIEMFEAVGERWWPGFFRRLGEMLSAGSAAAIQTITIAAGGFGGYRRKHDVLQR
ncbi:MAG: class I SAM-dependent methyltransferase [Actinobacteria bacterium]|nr:MAG: class I SAM-dependent methyltransferase [Actinomycetota bacterium]